jgi:hypothetical protein
VVNNYARLPEVKLDVAGMGVAADSTLDPVYLRLIERESRALDRALGRRFYSELATAEFDGNGRQELRFQHNTVEEWRGDLISVTTLKYDSNGDGTFDTTLTANSDYWLDPANPDTINEPAQRLLIPQGRSTAPQLSSWENYPRRFQIVGKWGYSEESEDSGLTGTLDDASDAAITASADASSTIYPGDVLIIESEQVYVSAVATDQVTVTRGINGTTAAAHSSSTLSIRRYPLDIEEAVSMRVVAARWDNNQGIPMGESSFSQSGGRQVFAKYNELRNRYARLVFV